MQWLDYLIADGIISAESGQLQIGDEVTEAVLVATANFVAPVTGLDAIRIAGRDAASFLHSQFTSDVLGLADGYAQRTAWCSPKGRVLMTADLIRIGNDYWLVMPQTQLPQLRERLQMYVLRAKVSVSAEPEHIVMGCGGRTVASLLERGCGVAAPSEVYGVKSAETTTILKLPGNVERYILILPAAQAPGVWRELQAGAQPVGTGAWDLLSITAGIPQVVPQTADEFLPQMLALEQQGALSFNKGCYPGQEIVARLQYRGELKRRLCSGTLPGVQHLTANERIVRQQGQEQSVVGHVVNSAVRGDGTTALLAVIETAVLDQPTESADLHVGSLPLSDYRALA